MQKEESSPGQLPQPADFRCRTTDSAVQLEVSLKRVFSWTLTCVKRLERLLQPSTGVRPREKKKTQNVVALFWEVSLCM